MTWVMFDEADHRSPVPFFRLPSVQSRQVALDDYRGRDNLVLFLPHGLDCQACRATLHTFADRRKDYDREDAVVLAIFPEPVERLKEDPDLMALPFPVLSDAEGKVRQAMAGLMAEGMVSPEDDLLLVLDQFGAPYAALIDAEFDDPGLHHDVLKWLEYIGMQCPE